jgi:hypothetical protein
MGLIYSLGRSNVTLANTTNDIGTIQSGALRSFRIKEAMFAGMSTTSIAIGIGIYRLTTIGVTTGGAMTPTPHNTNAGAFTGTTAVSWTTQSTVGTLIKEFAFNANGGILRWVAPPGYEIEVPAGGSNVGIVIRPTVASGSPVANYSLVIEEF